MTENATYCDKHVPTRKCIFFVVLTAVLEQWWILGRWGPAAAPQMSPARVLPGPRQGSCRGVVGVLGKGLAGGLVGILGKDLAEDLRLLILI